MFAVILLGLVGATTVVFLQDAKSTGPKQERLANVMKRIAGKNQKDQFVCTQLDERYAHYVYELDSNILSVLAGPDYITINAQRAKQNNLYWMFDMIQDQECILKRKHLNSY